MNHPDGPQVQISDFVIAHIKSIGLPAEKLEFRQLPGDGSRRLFWRVTTPGSGTSFIAMENAPTDNILKGENFAYLRIGTHLFRKGLPVPEIHRFDLANGWFIMEDMGDNHLQKTISSQKRKIPLYEKVVQILFRLQIEGAQGFDAEWCYQTQRYDRSVMRRYEADYFRDAFLCHYLGMKKDWPELEVPFNHLADTASKADNHFFLHRDFQAKNIMVTGGKIGVLDWQGGRLGPLPYDLASLLIDPYTDLSGRERHQIYECYLQLLGGHQSAWIDPFKKYFPYLAIQRNLQILGAFSYLTRVQGKSSFEAYIPPALKSLQGLLDELADRKLDPLKDLLNALPDLP